MNFFYSLQTLFRFLGGLSFAFILIALAALYAIVGTFLESMTDSHRYASLFTYESPLFLLLLVGFFINILLSALRRYPFRRHHVPFLITHLGMLLVIGGVMIKSLFGIQANMILVEGSATSEIFFPERYAIAIESRQGNSNYYPLPSRPSRFQRISAPNNKMVVTLLDYAPNSQEDLEGWVKRGRSSFFGLPSILLEANPLCHPITIDQKNWNFFALKGNEVAPQEIYERAVEVEIRNTSNGQFLITIPLQKLLEEEVLTPYGPLKAVLDWQNLTLIFKLPNESIQLKLTGNNALLNLNSKPFLGKSPLTIDLKAHPTLILQQTPSEDICFYLFDNHGQVSFKKQSPDDLTGIMAYEDGFSGYSREIVLSYPNDECDRNIREKQALYPIQEALKKAPQKELSPPLELLYKVCERTGKKFSEIAVAFLDRWNRQGGWLSPNLDQDEKLQPILEAIDWRRDITPSLLKGCQINASFFEHLDPLLKTRVSDKECSSIERDFLSDLKIFPKLIAGVTAEEKFLKDGEKDPQASPSLIQNSRLEEETDLIVLLKELHWPSSLPLAMTTCPPEKWNELLQTLSLQLFSVAPHFQELPPTSNTSALITAYFRAYGLHLSQVHEPPDLSEYPEQTLTLETPLIAVHQLKPALKKLEDNIPCIALRFQMNGKEETLSLSFDPSLSHLKWPIFQGEYRVRFQPLVEEIPYKIRLRQARQIHYAGTEQPHSYESDLLITDKRDGQEIETSISINNVYETWDGYRFYLSNISPANDPGALKKVQIVVNRDPTKYILTYPGAFLMALGILFLFFGPRKKN